MEDAAGMGEGDRLGHAEEEPEALGQRLGARSSQVQALSLDVPSLIVLPIDYSIDVAMSELGNETVST